MVEICCGTCSRKYDGCSLEDFCTRNPKLNIPESKRDVHPMDVGIHDPADYWDEGTDLGSLKWRIEQLEKKLEGV
jgi:hypothetical protein